MTAQTLQQAAEVLRDLQTEDPQMARAIKVMEDSYTTGDISGQAIAFGRNARAVVQHFNLPATQVATLLEARGALLGLDPERYHLRTLLADKTENFVGRDHVFQRIENFLNDNEQGYLIIEGDPGLGKSAILAEYVRRTGYVAHFNVRGQGIVSVAQFLESVCSQLIVDYGLPYPLLPDKAIQDGALLERLVQEACATLGPGERLVIVVDALDEVDLTTQGRCANILCLPPALPKGAYFILSKRPQEVPMAVQVDQKLLDLMTFPADNRHDVELFLNRSLQRPQIRAWIDAQQLAERDFVRELAGISENNFMYLRYVIPDIESGKFTHLTLNALPEGLTGYYKDHWQRMGMLVKPLPRLKLTIIYILCETRRPVSRDMILGVLRHNMFDADALQIQEVLDEWEPFLHKKTAPVGKQYSIYHASFRDFLYQRDIVQAAGVDIKDINALMGDYLFEDFFGNEAMPGI